MKILKPMIAGFAILLSLSFSLSAQTPEPPCDFSDPCLEDANGDINWQTHTLIYTPCTGCTITIEYLVASAECEVDSVYKDHFGIYLNSYLIPTTCWGVGKCFSTADEALAAASQYFYDEVLAPLENPNTDYIEFQLKPCWKSVATEFGTFYELCDDELGCCEFWYEDGQWQEVPMAITCGEPSPSETCFIMCGYWGIMLIPGGTLKLPTGAVPDDIKIHPNPASDELNIATNAFIEGEITLEILDINGNAVLSNSFSKLSGVTTLNIVGINSGAYFLKITKNETVVATEKFIISK